MSATIIELANPSVTRIGDNIERENNNLSTTSDPMEGGELDTTSSTSPTTTTAAAATTTTNTSTTIPLPTTTTTPNYSTVTKLFVGQIPRSYDAQMVSALFQRCGKILDVTIITDKVNGTHCGCAFIIFSSVEEAKTAIEIFDNKQCIPPMKNPLQVRIANANYNKGNNPNRNNNNNHSLNNNSYGGTNNNNSNNNNQMNITERAPDQFNSDLHEPNKIFVTPVAAIDEKELTRVFSTFGEILNILFITSHEGNKIGSIITFSEHAHAIAATQAHATAMTQNNNTEIPLVVKWARKNTGMRNPGLSPYGTGPRQLLKPNANSSSSNGSIVTNSSASNISSTHSNLSSSNSSNVSNNNNNGDNSPMHASPMIGGVPTGGNPTNGFDGTNNVVLVQVPYYPQFHPQGGSNNQPGQQAQQQMPAAYSIIPPYFPYYPAAAAANAAGLSPQQQQQMLFNQQQQHQNYMNAYQMTQMMENANMMMNMENNNSKNGISNNTPSPSLSNGSSSNVEIPNAGVDTPMSDQQQQRNTPTSTVLNMLEGSPVQQYHQTAMNNNGQMNKQQQQAYIPTGYEMPSPWNNPAAWMYSPHSAAMMHPGYSSPAQYYPANFLPMAPTGGSGLPGGDAYMLSGQGQMQPSAFVTYSSPATMQSQQQQGQQNNSQVQNSGSNSSTTNNNNNGNSSGIPSSSSQQQQQQQQQGSIQMNTAQGTIANGHMPMSPPQGNHHISFQTEYNRPIPTTVPIGYSIGNTNMRPGNNPHIKYVEGPPGANIFVKGLPIDMREEELQSIFEPYGTVVSVKVFVDRVTDISRRFGFLGFSNPNSAQLAVKEMSGKVLRGNNRLFVDIKRGDHNNQSSSSISVEKMSQTDDEPESTPRRSTGSEEFTEGYISPIQAQKKAAV